MVKLNVYVSLTLDGVFEGPAKTPYEPFVQAGWTAPYSDEEFMKYVAGNMSGESALLLGRVTYDSFAPSWTSQTGPAADYMNKATKYVVSTTLNKVDWNNSILIKGNVAEEIARLKQETDKPITVLGSGVLVQTLMEHDLIDGYSFLIYPVVLGAGKHFFGGTTRKGLKLRDSKTFKSGIVALTYVPEKSN